MLNVKRMAYAVARMLPRDSLGSRVERETRAASAAQSASKSGAGLGWDGSVPHDVMGGGIGGASQLRLI